MTLERKRRLKERLLRSCLFLVTSTLFFLALAPHHFSQSSPAFDSVSIGALDPDAWNGVVFLAKAFQQPAFFALRLGSRSGNFLDGSDIFNAVAQVGPHAPDSSYCQIAWRHAPREAQISFEWSRLDQTTVVGRVKAAQDFQIVIETYLPFLGVTWGTQGFFSLTESNQAIAGERFFERVFGPTARFLVIVDRPTVGSGLYPSLAQLRENMSASGKLASAPGADQAGGTAGLEFTTGELQTAHFVAALGWDKDALLTKAKGLLAANTVDNILDEKSQAYTRSRPGVQGLFEGAPEAIGNNMFWNAIYAPSNGLIFPSISRQWARTWGGWVVGEWDCFFGSLLTSVEDKAQTTAAIKAILLAQTETGLVPNIAAGSGITPDRSQPPVGSYCLWKVYQRFQDREMLEWAYPRLKRWHDWWLADRGDGQPWRDGNRDGLLEWGSDRGSMDSTGGRGFMQAAKYETGLDDSPMYDEVNYDSHTYTMNLHDVGLNSLYALDAECLSRIAALLGKTEDSQRLAAEYETMKKRVREKLWNDQDGIYENRFWDGHFSKRLSPTNFYPMFAGIATPEQAKRMIEEHLLNPKEFWGKYVAPTIARNDPAFPDQFYWRGDIWGPTNYMLYEGINRYRFDKVALQYAQKSYDLFMDDWRINQHNNEQYHAWGGNGGGDKHYTWGTLLCLVALEQYIDQNPWEGLRFGALDPPTGGEFRGAIWENHSYDIAIGPGRTELKRDGRLRFEANGAVVVRQYEQRSSRLSFTIKGEQPVQVTTAEFDSGEVNLRIDGRAAGKVGMARGLGRFDVPGGEHIVELVKEP
ncbi:MAG: hypothetical protein DMG10_15690 [Acidobacteria bacterium]|nr:MAG: hypothetical protein DMG10_15690 [Acidobacteriota bacterium]